MHRTTLLLPEHIWREVQRQAAEQGISASAYIRECLIARIYWERGRRRADEAPGE